MMLLSFRTKAQLALTACGALVVFTMLRPAAQVAVPPPVVAGFEQLHKIDVQVEYLRDIAIEAAARGVELPPGYAAHLGCWAALGFPALFSFLAIFYLMVAKPAIQVP